jgi:hypothetical protein
VSSNNKNVSSSFFEQSQFEQFTPTRRFYLLNFFSSSGNLLQTLMKGFLGVVRKSRGGSFIFLF